MEEIINNILDLHDGEKASPIIIGKKSVIFITTTGRVISLSAKQRATRLNRGYEEFRDDYGCYKVHRLVATAFIPNPELKPTVNHIDGVKTNNRVENLEWATQKENSQHARKNGLVPEVKKESRKYTKEQFRNIIEKIINEGYSIKHACSMYGMPYSTIAVGFMRLRQGKPNLLDDILTDEEKGKICNHKKGLRW